MSAYLIATVVLALVFLSVWLFKRGQAAGSADVELEALSRGNKASNAAQRRASEIQSEVKKDLEKNKTDGGKDYFD